MDVLVLSGPDVRASLDMATCVDAMERAFLDLAAGAFQVPVRTVVAARDDTVVLATMPAMRETDARVHAVKEIVVTPANGGRGLDPHQGVVVLHAGESGRVVAILDATAITELRTAAVSAVATRALANPGARRVAILGSGAQARAHAEALRVVLDDPELTVWGRTPAHAERLGADLGARVARSAEDAVRDADIVCTTTAASEPIVARQWFGRGVHINASGASRRMVRELDTATMAAAALFVDRRESALVEAGDYVLAAAEGAIGPEHIRAELAEVLAGEHPGRASADELTVFKSVGLAIEDLAAAEACLLRARELGIGQPVAL